MRPLGGLPQEALKDPLSQQIRGSLKDVQKAMTGNLGGPMMRSMMLWATEMDRSLGNSHVACIALGRPAGL